MPQLLSKKKVGKPMLKLIKTISRVGVMLITAALSLPSFAEVINVDDASLQQLLDQGVPIVDVRRAEEWHDTGVIENSHLITFFDSKGQYDAKKWLSELGAIVGPDEPVILICHSGARSKLISQWLNEKQGYAMVYNVANGIISWKQNGDASLPLNAMSLQ